MISTTAVTGVLALVGPGLEPLEDATVLFSREILEIGPTASTSVPDDVIVVDGTSMCLMPGFIDTHVHTHLHPPRRLLAGGITTARDLGWHPDIVLASADVSMRDGIDGPTVIAAGPIITTPGGYPELATWHGAKLTAHAVDSTEEATALVRELIARGAALIKIALDARRGPTLPKEIVSAIADEAHRLGKTVTAHVSGLAELEKAVNSRVDELAHALMSPDRIPDALLDRMVGQRMAICTTVMWRTPEELAANIDNLHRFHAKGGLILYGTDIGCSGATPDITGPTPGIEPRELLAMRDAGMSTTEVLQAATSKAAAWLGLTDVGEVTVGKIADLVLALGNPLKELKRAGNVQQVWRRGMSVL